MDFEKSPQFKVAKEEDKAESTKSLEPEAEKIPEEIVYRENEYSEQYLSRVEKFLKSKFNLDFLKPAYTLFHPDIDDKTRDQVFNELEKSTSAEHDYNQETCNVAINKIKSLYGQGNVPGDFEDLEFFKGTHRTTPFFPDVYRGGKVRNYAAQLFGLSSVDERVIDYYKKILNQKNILLFGGGYSHVHNEFRAKGINTGQIINVDPYIDKVKSSNEKLCKVGAESTALQNELEDKFDFKNADEIWALYSVPYYMETPNQIKGLFDNAQKLLAPGGKLRIAPLNLYMPDDRTGNEMHFNIRLESIIKQLHEINQTGEFNIYLTDENKGGALIIEKLAKNKVNKDDSMNFSQDVDTENNSNEA